jgi:undecaprenyl-diphosphatase
MMMDMINAAIMGIVEGVTEFLPISSTGHLIIMDEVLGFKGPAGKVFEISIQLGAILAICWLYRERLWHMATNLARDPVERKFATDIILAFLPAAVLGFFLHHAITHYLFNVPVVASMMVLGGFAILAIEKYKPKPHTQTLNDISPRQAVAIGFCQSLAMIPGVSRSGATIMGSLMLGIERKAATEFSFFLAIPTMFAATVFDLYKNRADLSMDGLTLIAVGFVVAFLSALVVVKWLITFISRHGFAPFAWYRIVVGSVILLALAVHH